jgi:hypothetical protein
MKKSLLICCFVSSLATFLSCLKEADLPTLTTTDVSSVKTQSASLGGNVTDDGGAKVDLRGVCWGTADNPTIADSNKYYWKGTGGFTCLVTGLTPDTYYHVRAFAMNREGTAYGNEVHFRTKQIIAPKVTTTADTLSTTLTTITVRGNITNYDETLCILERGFCWATTAHPTTINKMLRCGEGPGSFEVNLYPLQPGTLYYIRAYAVTIAGITYGNEIQFKTNTLPDVSTAPVTEFSRTTARAGGNLSDPDFFDNAGICYGTTAGPIINGYFVSTESIGNDGVFTCTLTNLIPGTRYYARAYVTVSEWYWWINYDYETEFIIYGNEVTFTTSQ